MPSREKSVSLLSFCKIIDIPEFVKSNEKLQKAWVEKWEQLVTGSFDLSQSILLPHNEANFESKLDKVLKDQRAQDINELIAQCKQKFIQ
jgi:hypothetical protein